MGFALFESSGTFNPASYGLVVGDTIQVVAVGGGGKGDQGTTGVGANGGASSFGSYVTAAGASAGTDTYGVRYENENIASYFCIGSDGEHGWGSALWRMPAWIPGVDIDIYNIFMGLAISGSITLRSAGLTDKAEDGSASAGGYGAKNYAAGGRGGLGFGAGGGGGACITDNHTYNYAGSGGKAGTVKIAAVTLSSLSSIAVTVGTGGAGGASNHYATGGKGANAA